MTKNMWKKVLRMGVVMVTGMAAMFTGAQRASAHQDFYRAAVDRDYKKITPNPANKTQNQTPGWYMPEFDFSGFTLSPGFTQKIVPPPRGA